jgi:hypothetical protein
VTAFGKSGFKQGDDPRIPDPYLFENSTAPTIDDSRIGTHCKQFLHQMVVAAHGSTQQGGTPQSIAPVNVILVHFWATPGERVVELNVGMHRVADVDELDGHLLPQAHLTAKRVVLPMEVFSTERYLARRLAATEWRAKGKEVQCGPDPQPLRWPAYHVYLIHEEYQSPFGKLKFLCNVGLDNLLQMMTGPFEGRLPCHLLGDSR